MLVFWVLQHHSGQGVLINFVGLGAKNDRLQRFWREGYFACPYPISGKTLSIPHVDADAAKLCGN